MITLLLAWLSLRCETALAIPIPMAVPGWIMPSFCSVQVAPLNVCTNIAWSVVSGHCVYASPPNNVKPMLSLGRLLIKFSATSLAAVMRLGNISFVAIEVEMSSANIMSIPSVSPVFHEDEVWGRAIAVTTNTKQMMRRKKGMWINLVRQVWGDVLKHSAEAHLRCVSLFELKRKYHIK